MVKEIMEKEIYRQQAANSRIREGDLGKRQGGSPLLDQFYWAGGGKKISTPLTFFPSDTKSSHGMDPLVPSQRIAHNDST